MDCSPAGSFVHGISQARILEWVAISSSRKSSWPRDRTSISYVSCISRWILHHWAIWEGLCHGSGPTSCSLSVQASLVLDSLSQSFPLVFVSLSILYPAKPTLFWKCYSRSPPFCTAQPLITCGKVWGCWGSDDVGVGKEEGIGCHWEEQSWLWKKALQSSGNNVLMWCPSGPWGADIGLSRLGYSDPQNT